MPRDVSRDAEWRRQVGFGDYDDIIVKVAVHVRVTAPLLHTIHHYARRAEESRQGWVEGAVSLLIERGEPAPCLLTAEHLLGRKAVIVIRLEPLVLDVLDEMASDRGTRRQVLMVDACLTRIAAEYQESGD
jgi:hypothetical protein